MFSTIRRSFTFSVCVCLFVILSQFQVFLSYKSLIAIKLLCTDFIFIVNVQ